MLGVWWVGKTYSVFQGLSLEFGIVRSLGEGKCGFVVLVELS